MCNPAQPANNKVESLQRLLRQSDSESTAPELANIKLQVDALLSADQAATLDLLPASDHAALIALMATDCLPREQLLILCPSTSIQLMLESPEVFVGYWSDLACAAKNCWRRERYAAIALQLSEKNRLKVDRRMLGQIHIQAAMDAAAICELKACGGVMRMLRRAMRFALSLGQPDDAVKVAEAMAALAEKCWSSGTKEVNLWPQCFDAILVEQAGRLSVSTGLRDKLIIEMEASFQATLDSLSAGFGMDSFAVARDAKRLVNFYRREKRSADIDRTATSLQQATLRGCENISPMHITICVQPTVQFLDNNGFSELADELAAKMLGCLNTLPGLMQEWRFSMEIPIIEVQKEIEGICAFETSEAIRRLVLARVPPPPAGDDSSLLSANIISPQTIDESGRTTSAARSPEEAGEQIMIVAYCNERQIDGQILEFSV